MEFISNNIGFNKQKVVNNYIPNLTKKSKTPNNNIFTNNLNNNAPIKLLNNNKIFGPENNEINPQQKPPETFNGKFHISKKNRKKLYLSNNSNIKRPSTAPHKDKKLKNNGFKNMKSNINSIKSDFRFPIQQGIQGSIKRLPSPMIYSQSNFFKGEQGKNKLIGNEINVNKSYELFNNK